MTRRRELALCVLLSVFALGVRLWPIDHGAPRNYVEDTHVVKNALGMLRDKDPIPPVGKYSSYPNLLPYLLIPVYVGQFAVGSALGEWSGAEGYGDHVLAHPESVQILARILVAVFGGLTPWVVFRAARAAGLARGAWVAAWLVATSLLHVHYSVQERPWIPLVFFLGFSVWGAARYVESGAGRHLLACGLAAALSFSSHQAGLALAILPALAWLHGPLGWSGADLKRRLSQGFACALAYVALALAVGHPYLLRYGLTPEESVLGGDAAHVAVGGQGVIFRFRPDLTPGFARTFFAYDPVLITLAVLGLAGAWRRRTLRPVAVAGVVWTAYFLTHETKEVRYLLPLSVLFALPAGLFVERFARSRVSSAVFAVVLLLPLLPVLRLCWILSRSDTRADAEIRLAALPPRARVAIDRYGPLVDLDRASLERLSALRQSCGRELRSREAFRLEQLRAGTDVPPGIDAVQVEDLILTDEIAKLIVDEDKSVRLRPGLVDTPGVSSQADLRGLLRGLGVTHFLFVNRYPSDPVRHLMADLVEGLEPLFVVNPGTGAAPPAEARLPKDVVDPLEHLWSVDRPGPWMALYELP